MPVSIPYTAPETEEIDKIVKELGSLSLPDSEQAGILRNELLRLRKFHYSSMIFSLFPCFPRNIERSYCRTEPAHDTIAKLVFHSSSSRTSGEQDAFKFGLCERYPDRVKFISLDNSNFLIRCMITDCWLPRNECIAGHIFARQYRNLMCEVVAVGPNVIRDDQNGMLWARGIETAFSCNEVCLMYNPLEQKLIFFVLNSNLLDQVICFSSNQVIKFKDVDGKPLDFGGLPSLRLLMLHAKSAIRQTRQKIEYSQWEKPSHWDTVETLNSMMQDAADRLCQDSGQVNQRSPEVFAQSAAEPAHARSAAKLLKLFQDLPPYLSPSDEVFKACLLSRTASSASSGSPSSGSKNSNLGDFRARIENGQSQLIAAKAASSQLAVATGSNSAAVAPSAVAARASVSTSSNSCFQNRRQGPVQPTRASSMIRAVAAPPGTTDRAPAQPLVPHRPRSAHVVSRGGLMTPTFSSTMHRVSQTRPAALDVSQQPKANKKGKKKPDQK